MRFKYRLKIFVDEHTARKASIAPEVVKKLRNTGTKLTYHSGVMELESKENHDVDEDLVKTIVKIIGRPVEAVAEIEVNGRVKEIFSGKLDPLKPLGMISTEHEEEEVEEELVEETEDEEELFLDEEDMDEEDLYFGFRVGEEDGEEL